MGGWVAAGTRISAATAVDREPGDRADGERLDVGDDIGMSLS